jgi:ferredoxin--NADP+ reductase
MFELWVRAPHVARHARAGQFAILRIDEHGERIPLTISAVRGEQVRLIFMAVGNTTCQLAGMRQGEIIRDVSGPPGNRARSPGTGPAPFVGGRAGIACSPIIARELREAGNRVIGNIGARNRDFLILQDEMQRSRRGVAVRVRKVKRL